MIRGITKEYIEHITDIKMHVEKLVKLDKELELKEEIFNMGILSMCIKYEAFTSDAYSDIFRVEKIKYNHPWFYTREISKFLEIKNQKEYMNARDGWTYYNTLKHVNSRTRISREKIKLEHNIKNSEEAFYWIFESLMKLLKTFL